LHTSLAQQTISAEREPKFQDPASAPSSEIFWLRPSKIA